MSRGINDKTQDPRTEIAAVEIPNILDPDKVWIARQVAHIDRLLAGEDEKAESIHDRTHT